MHPSILVTRTYCILSTNQRDFIFQLLDNCNSISRDTDLFAETDPVLLPPACPLVIPEERPPLQEQQKLELLGQRQTPTRGDKLPSTDVECNSYRQRVLKLRTFFRFGIFLLIMHLTYRMLNNCISCNNGYVLIVDILYTIRLCCTIRPKQSWLLYIPCVPL